MAQGQAKSAELAVLGPALAAWVGPRGAHSPSNKILAAHIKQLRIPFGPWKFTSAE